jgi:hypothetical protein
MEGMSSVLVRNPRGGASHRRHAVRHGFLATLDARTWRPRAHAAAALADPEAVSGRAPYVAWLHRAAAAWSRLPQPPAGPWPLAAVGPRCLALLPEIEADLRALCPAGEVAVPRPRAADGTDDAFVAGAAYVAVVAAADAAVLTAAATALAAGSPGTRAATRFLRACTELAPTHRALRRELADRAAAGGPDVADRVVLTARALSLDLAEALQG